MQREVQVQIDSMDKAGNFIGWLWVEGQNLSVLLVEEGDIFIFSDFHS